MNDVDVIIAGAGISGLYAAWQLQQAGISYVVLEARNRTGGRVFSQMPPVSALATGFSETGIGRQQAMRVDLGATWVWPEVQPQLDELLHQLDIPLFPQSVSGSQLYERHGVPGVKRQQGYAYLPVAQRIQGGLMTLVDALVRRVPPSRLLTSHQVTHVQRTSQGVSVSAVSAEGKAYVCNAGHLLLALPPRLAASMTFTPALPPALSRAWRDTATWMAPHAKYVALYPEAFWRKQGLSGEARSETGPMVEIHDASAPGGACALFGFIGVPARSRQRLDDASLQQLCRAQLVRLFGEPAGRPLAEFFQDWAREPFTTTGADLRLTAEHRAPASYAREGEWQHVISGAASEWSASFPGYIAGAVEAAAEAVARYLQHKSEGSSDENL